MSIPVLAGRGFTAVDSEPGTAASSSTKPFSTVSVSGWTPSVSESRRFLPLPGQIARDHGVVGNSRLTGIRNDVPPQVFTPRLRGDTSFLSFVFYVRSTMDPGAMAAMVRPLIASIDSNLPVSQLRTMTQQLRGQTNGDRLIATLSAIFAGLATALAAVGLYAVLSYNVNERTRELGLRLALGASPGALLGMVMKQIGGSRPSQLVSA